MTSRITPSAPVPLPHWSAPLLCLSLCWWTPLNPFCAGGSRLCICLFSQLLIPCNVTEESYRLVMPFSWLVGLFQSNVGCVGDTGLATVYLNFSHVVSNPVDPVPGHCFLCSIQQPWRNFSITSSRPTLSSLLALALLWGLRPLWILGLYFGETVFTMVSFFLLLRVTLNNNILKSKYLFLHQLVEDFFAA